MKRIKKNTVAFIGLGIMGKPMVINLLKEGMNVFFYARKKSVINEITKKGGKFVPVISDLTKHSEIFITNLPNTQDVEEVIIGKNGISNTMRKGSIVIDMSTISPEVTTKINNMLEEKSSFLLDCPVSGGQAGAISGELSIMVGGNKKAFAKVKYVLSIIGKNISYIGKSGSGQICKACNQILVAQSIHAVSNIISISKKAKINPSIVRTALLAGYANSKVLEIHGERMIKSKYKPGFKLSLHNKDLRIARDMIKSVGLKFDALDKVKKIMDVAMKEGLSDYDSSAIHYILEKTHK